MFKSILLPTDGSVLSEKIIGQAIQFAQLNQARIVAISDGSMVLDAGAYQLQMDEAARQHVARVASAAQAARVPFEGVVAVASSPYEAIVEAAS